MEAAETKTLFDLREERGLSHADVVAGIADFLREDPKHWTANAQYERRGVKSIDIIEALAHVYGVSMEQARDAAKNSRLRGLPSDARRSPRKASSLSA